MMPTRPIASCVVLLGLLLSGEFVLGNDEPLPEPFITKLGDYRLFDGKVTIHMIEQDDFIVYKFEEPPRTEGTSTVQITQSPTQPRIKSGVNWFVYPVSADEAWIYEGGDALTVYTTGDDPILHKADAPKFARYKQSHIFICADETHNIVKEAPKEVLARLPKSLKWKYGVKD